MHPGNEPEVGDAQFVGDFRFVDVFWGNLRADEKPLNEMRRPCEILEIVDGEKKGRGRCRERVVETQLVDEQDPVQDSKSRLG